MTEILVAIVAEVAALAGIILSNNSNIKELRKDLAQQREYNDKQYLAILRLTVMSEEMPISERIIAGKEYIDHGGNGDVKRFYEKLLKDHTK